MADQLHFIWEILPKLLFGFPGHQPGGLLLTILLACVGIGIGLLLAIPLGHGARAENRPVRWLCRSYIVVIRGIPLLLLLVIMFQIVGNQQYGLNLSPLAAAVITLVLYSSAYLAEIVRTGLQAVPAHWLEAAQVVGGHRRFVFWRLELPSALRMTVPALVGMTISLFKDTSVVIILGVADLMTIARIVIGSNVTNAPYWVAVYLTVGALYFIVAFGLTRLSHRFEATTHDFIHTLRIT